MFLHDLPVLRVSLPDTLWETLLPGLCRTGRCLLRRVEPDAELTTLAWCDGPP